MSRKTLVNLITLASLTLNAAAPLPATAGEGIFTIPLGENTDLCVGGWSCLFSEASDDGRDDDGVTDHRSGDGANDDGSRDNTVVLVGPQVRDHRSTPTVRDHRSTPTVRDHRSTPQNEVVPASAEKFECRVGAVKLQRMGYRSINAYDCDGAVYHYTAQDGASLFRAAFKAYSGDIEVTFIGIAN